MANPSNASLWLAELRQRLGRPGPSGTYSNRPAMEGEIRDPAAVQQRIACQIDVPENSVREGWQDEPGNGCYRTSDELTSGDRHY